jgi:thioredoxin reductase (NADPH)
LDVILVERGRDIGGQLHRIFAPIENYLGLRASDGSEMLSHFRASAERFGFRRILDADVVSIDAAARRVVFADGIVATYRALIIATGVRRRMLNVDGETEFRGKGVIDSGVRDQAMAKGRRVVIVGGGDAAVENALILGAGAESVTMVHRRDKFTAREEFLASLDKMSNVDIVFNSMVTRIEGDDKVSAVEIEDVVSKTKSSLPADVVLVRIGVEPNSDLVRGVVDLDNAGYIKVDASCRTSVNGLFAAGDVANPVSPTLSTASGMGATAAKAAYLFIDNN